MSIILLPEQLQRGEAQFLSHGWAVGIIDVHVVMGLFISCVVGEHSFVLCAVYGVRGSLR